MIDLTDWKLIGDQRRILPLASLFLLFTGGAVLGEWQIELIDSPIWLVWLGSGIAFGDLDSVNYRLIPAMQFFVTLDSFPESFRSR